MLDQAEVAARQTHWPTKTFSQLMLGLKPRNTSCFSRVACAMEKHVSPAFTPCTLLQLSAGTVTASLAK